jgi:SAM-dependent methyltransferase
MENTEIKRIQRDFGWNPNLTSLPVVNGFENKSWLVPESSYSDEKTEYLDVPEGSSWWYETRNRIILGAIRKHGNSDCLWDIGSGPGVVGSYLAKNGVSCIGVEPSKSGVFVAAKGGLPSVLSDLVSLRLPDDCIGQIGLFDVYEHIEFRGEFLAEIFRVLKPGGSIFITVPALSLLWSESDVEADHFLRFSKNKLRNEISSCGLRIQSVDFFFWTLVLPVLMLRVLPFRLGIKRPVKDAQLIRAKAGLFGKVMQKIELVSFRRTSIGSSLLLVAKKPG